MKNLLIASVLASLSVFTLQPALAQQTGLWTVTVGVDYVQGKYNTNSNDNWTWTVPFIVKYETGPITLKANIPYVSTHGVNRDVGQAIGIGAAITAPLAETQEGLGDTVLSAFYTVADPSKFGVGVDLGVKVKLVTADKDKDLITTGNEDYSLQADLYKAFGPYTAFGTIGWTSKGDIRFRDRDPLSPTFGLFLESNPRDPWYLSVGASYKLSPETSVGFAYDWREKLFSSSDPVSEATLFVTNKLTKNWKLQGYGLVGFSDASPDWGLGATLGYAF